MWCSGLGIYGFMFLRLREFVSVVFELWVRGGKNLKLGVGKRENMGYEQEKKEKRKKKWSGEESKSGLWARQNNLRFGVGKTKICCAKKKISL